MVTRARRSYKEDHPELNEQAHLTGQAKEHEENELNWDADY